MEWLSQYVPDSILAIVRFLTSAEVGSLASVFSAVITLFLLANVRTIKAHFLFRARIPKLLASLQENASTLNQGLTEYDGSKDLIDVELARCHANLTNLRPKVTKVVGKNIGVVLQRIERYQNGLKSKEIARDIYTRLNGVMQELRNFREDTEWSDSNVG